MSRVIRKVLENFNELDTADPGSDIYQIKHDITRALNNADLTDEERGILAASYFLNPIPPERDKLDKNGNTSGRPSGGITQAAIYDTIFGQSNKSINAKNIDISRKISSACEKMADFLGSEYQDDTSKTYN